MNEKEFMHVNSAVYGDTLSHSKSEHCLCKPKRVYDHECDRYFVIHRPQIDPKLISVMPERLSDE